jgi:DNA-binding transcriptional LysR family regulator
MRLDFLGLQAFLAVAERGSFHRAAAFLGVTQTALSHRIRKFEDNLGAKVLLRTTRQVSLTPTGLSLLPKARQLVDDALTVFGELTAQASARQERIAIGCLPTLTMHFLPDVVAAFHDAYPAINLRVFDNSASEIAERVQKGEAEFGITILAANRWDLEARIVGKEPYVLICPADHALAKHKTVSWRELAGAPMIRIATQTGNRILIDDALGSRRESLRWIYEVQHVASAVALVAAGAGLTVVPRVAIDVVKSTGLTAVRLRDPAVTRTLVAVTRRGVPLTPPAEALMALIVARLKDRL